MKENEKDHIEDLFLKALIKNDGLKVPSRDFTSKVMAKIPSGKVVIEESSRFMGRNLTLLIFFLVGIINLVVLYFLWPYITVWVPENSMLTLIFDSIILFAKDYASRIFDQSATIALLFIIGFGVFVIVGSRDWKKNLDKFSKRLPI